MDVSGKGGTLIELLRALAGALGAGWACNSRSSTHRKRNLTASGNVSCAVTPAFSLSACCLAWRISGLSGAQGPVVCLIRATRRAGKLEAQASTTR